MRSECRTPVFQYDGIPSPSIIRSALCHRLFIRGHLWLLSDAGVRRLSSVGATSCSRGCQPPEFVSARITKSSGRAPLPCGVRSNAICGASYFGARFPTPTAFNSVAQGPRRFAAHPGVSSPKCPNERQRRSTRIRVVRGFRDPGTPAIIARLKRTPSTPAKAPTRRLPCAAMPALSHVNRHHHRQSERQQTRPTDQPECHHRGRR